MADTPKTEAESPLAAFEKTLLPEEGFLIHDYVQAPTPETLSEAFDKTLKEAAK